MNDPSDTAVFDPRWSRERCPRCGAGFGCGAQAGPAVAPCWCAALPPFSRERIDAGGVSGCLCPDCLRAMTAPAADLR